MALDGAVSRPIHITDAAHSDSRHTKQGTCLARCAVQGAPSRRLCSLPCFFSPQCLSTPLSTAPQSSRQPTNEAQKYPSKTKDIFTPPFVRVAHTTHRTSNHTRPLQKIPHCLVSLFAARLAQYQLARCRFVKLSRNAPSALPLTHIFHSRHHHLESSLNISTSASVDDLPTAEPYLSPGY